jgi:large subunit ribosomal protein L22
VEKLVKSAVANAQQTDPNVDLDRLYVTHATVDDAPPMKRARSRAMGRVFRILKRACHVSIHLDLPAKSGD